MRCHGQPATGRPSWLARDSALSRPRNGSPFRARRFYAHTNWVELGMTDLVDRSRVAFPRSRRDSPGAHAYRANCRSTDSVDGKSCAASLARTPRVSEHSERGRRIRSDGPSLSSNHGTSRRRGSSASVNPALRRVFAQFAVLMVGLYEAFAQRRTARSYDQRRDRRSASLRPQVLRLTQGGVGRLRYRYSRRSNRCSC